MSGLLTWAGLALAGLALLATMIVPIQLIGLVVITISGRLAPHDA